VKPNTAEKQPALKATRSNLMEKESTFQTMSIQKILSNKLLTTQIGYHKSYQKPQESSQNALLF